MENRQYRQYIKGRYVFDTGYCRYYWFMVIRYGIQGALVAAALQNAIVGIAMLALNFEPMV